MFFSEISYHVRYCAMVSAASLSCVPESLSYISRVGAHLLAGSERSDSERVGIDSSTSD